MAMARSAWGAKKATLVGAMSLMAVVCTSAEADEAAMADAHESDEVELLSEWVGTSTSGVEITLRSTEGAPVVGPIRFEIEVDRPDMVQPRSLDIVSPTMPMHGVLRYPVHGPENGLFHAETTIPMEGSWAVYVNLDEGADAAEFLFRVEPSPTEGAHKHAPPSPADEGGGPGQRPSRAGVVDPVAP